MAALGWWVRMCHDPFCLLLGVESLGKVGALAGVIHRDFMGELGFYYTTGVSRGMYGFRRSPNTLCISDHSHKCTTIQFSRPDK